MIPLERLQELFGLDLTMLLEGMPVEKVSNGRRRGSAVIIVVLKPREIWPQP